MLIRHMKVSELCLGITVNAGSPSWKSPAAYR